MERSVFPCPDLILKYTNCFVNICYPYLGAASHLINHSQIGEIFENFVEKFVKICGKKNNNTTS